MIFDTHIHLNDEKLLSNLDEYINEAKECGVEKFLCIGYDVESSKKAIEIANCYKDVYASVGIIPTEHKQFNEHSINLLEKLAKSSNKVIAIGEIGLDYYREKDLEIKEKQQNMFIEQIRLANRLNLPISIHSRDAMQDTFNILKENNCNKKGILHCYSGSLEMGREFIKLGYYLAFGGTLTFKNAIKNRETFLNIPLDKIVFETDAPYLAPTPYRGKINLPKYIKNTVQFAASLRNIDENYLEEVSYNNALNVFDL